jgi:MraZ protein
MTQFMGTHTNKLDAKGRVSIPAPFRTALKNGDDSCALILRPSHKYPCLEGWSVAAFDALATSMQHMPTLGDDQEDLAFTVFGRATPLEPDREGRIVPPAGLAAHAHLKDAVCFIGLNTRFQIWEPEAAERRFAEASARARGLALPGTLP